MDPIAHFNQFLLLIDGPMGGGKSSVTDILKTELMTVLFTGIDRLKWSISGFSRSHEENQIAAHLVEALTKAALLEGISVCVDQGFMKSEYAQPYINMAKELNIDLFIYQIEAPRDILIQRALSRKPAPEAKEPLPKERIENNINTYFTNKYLNATVIDSHKLSQEEIADVIMKRLKTAQKIG